MDIDQDLGEYLARKRARRLAMFKDAASASLLMRGVTFLCRHFYHLLDLYSRVYMRIFLSAPATDSADARAKQLSKLDADATDTYHVCWCLITFLCCWGGWQLWNNESEELGDMLLWLVPIVPCIYRIFEILAALIEIYFGQSDAKHHQFRILLHAMLHYLTAGFAFALFYTFVDWKYESFSSKNAQGKAVSQFDEMVDPIYQSLLTIVTLGVNSEPQDWRGKVLILFEVSIGFALATFIFLNITQIWLGGSARERRDGS